MDFTPEQLKKNAAIWNYDGAAELVKECESLWKENEHNKSHSTFARIMSESYSKAIITTKEILTLLYNGYPEGAMLAVLLMNAFAPLIDYCVVQANINRRMKRAKSQ